MSLLAPVTKKCLSLLGSDLALQCDGQPQSWAANTFGPDATRRPSPYVRRPQITVWFCHKSSINRSMAEALTAVILASIKLAPVAQHRSVIVGQGKAEFLIGGGWVVAMQEEAVIQM